MVILQGITGIFLEHKLTFLLQCLKIQKNLEHKLKKALLLLNFKKTLKRQQPARRIAERITVIHTSFRVTKLSWGLTKMGALRGGWTNPIEIWNSPHETLDGFSNCIQKRGLIGEFLSCLFFAFSLKSNCTDFSRERNTHEWYHKIT